MIEETLALARKYTDKQRIAYEFRKTTDGISQKMRFDEPFGDTGLYMAGFGSYDFPLNKNITMIINWNGTKYRCDLQQESETNYYFGNSSLGSADAEDTGEPFYCIRHPEINGGRMTWFSAQADEVDVQMSYEIDAIKTIDQKFIPGVVLQKIVLNEEDFMAMLNTEMILGEKHTAILDKALDDQSPVIVTFYSQTDNTSLSDIAPLSTSDDGYQLYQTTLMDADFAFLKHPEYGWVGKIQVTE